ncbi:hypothetical protein Dtox_1883 [Desulfofarcimen acetoxidans DSM 771]|uniref:Uncharacterized protein n=1 Tax=Desulfofarcimen acetoxidans (strain ATCC 49208 / DSM 771 / KCTC 5769 / VKM B-1644 / 5575) TaxID=485916 RepID=C8VXS3_DESAS|nr:hypothetical protein [Desulfofarcimen acetoxidans]ACV62729.1 hypothetical protein Dtox_1883 [Desulfofarcimen acetoxidans DSM 771]
MRELIVNIKIWKGANIMVTIEDMELVFSNFDRICPPLLISPIKLWEFDRIIKPKLENISNIQVIYPINLFGASGDKNTEIIIVTADNIFHKIICDTYNISINTIDDIDKLHFDLEADNNQIALNYNMNFMDNINLIENIKLQRMGKSIWDSL